MPSAANVKIEKTTAGAASVAAVGGGGSDNGLIDNSNASPLRQAITVVEHKIRNLEKRKSKLESYRDLQKSGKDLNTDQKTAIAKYDEVVQTLEFARDLCKQFLGIAVVSEKDDKKKARKEANARSQAELTKVREVLLIQDALTNMGQPTIRDDFLNARNGAAPLTQADLKLLDDYFNVVSPKHEAGDPTAFMPQVQAAAEHLLYVVDGKNKEIFGSTYSNIKEVIGKIHESGYLDQAYETYEAYEEAVVTETADVGIPAAVIEPPPMEQPVPLQHDLPPMQHAPPMSIVEQQAPPQSQPAQQQQPPMQPPPQLEPLPPMQPPVPEAQIFYQQPPPPQSRPISEVIGTGSFFFLQDSELDTPPEQIATQTFTNQTFVGAPPPPIPMPPHFQHQQFPTPTQPPQPQQQQPPPMQPQAQSPPQVQKAQVIQQTSPQQVVVQQQMPPAQSINLPPVSKNGFGDHQPDQQHDEVIRHRPGNRQNPQRSNITTHHQNHQQPFFANNNGYNRPNRNRHNGPRLNSSNNNSNRHNQQ